MKRKNKKLITFILAGMMCAATVGAVATTTAFDVSAATAQTYALTDVFSTTGGVIGADGEGETKTTAFTLANGNTVKYKRDLALKWHTGKTEAGAYAPDYLNLQFAFKDLNFKSVTFTFETAPAQSTKDEKSVNTIKFVNGTDGVSAKVNDEAAVALTVAAGDNLTLSLGAGDNFGEFKVFIGTTEIGVFTNIGVNYADYKADSMNSWKIEAETEGENKTTLLLNEINGQSFDNVTGASGSYVVTDDAAPVLVVNEDVRGYVLGTKFNLSYVAIDALQSSSLSETKQYYQYNPTKETFDESKDYSTLTISSSSGTVFMDTVYTEGEGENAVTTSVFEKEGAEYVSIKITLGDKAHTDASASTSETTDDKAVYELAWYADPAAVTKKTVATVEKDYIIFDRNTEGPTYKYIVANDTTKTNDADSAMDVLVEEYQAKLDNLAKDIHAGSNSRIDFPSMDWLIEDNNGYNNLEYTISYYVPSSTSAKSVSRDFDELYLKDLDEGDYEFKVFATDKAGNTMKYYVDEELVSVSTSNVWKIDEIPSFTFTIKNQGIYVEEEDEDDLIETEIIGDTYTMKDATVVGAGNQKSDYALFKIELSDYTGAGNLNVDTLGKITYEALLDEVKGVIPTITDGDYIGAYLTAYSSLVAKKIGGDAAKVKACFTEIAEYDDRITKDNEEAWNNSDNKYNWIASSKKFTAAEEGIYIIFADYSDADLSYVDRAAAYKLVEVDAEADSVKGETEWLKNNLVSVILFSVAGVMLILIIILLLIKPSDETLEDVDAKADKKKKNAKK